MNTVFYIEHDIVDWIETISQERNDLVIKKQCGKNIVTWVLRGCRFCGLRRGNKQSIAVDALQKIN